MREGRHLSKPEGPLARGYRVMMRQAIAVLLAAIVAAQSSGGTDGRAKALSAAAEAVLARQVGDGAIQMDPATHAGETHVVPYFASIGARGLVAASVVLRRPQYVDAACRWSDWYREHMRPDGVVEDYSGASGRWKATGDCDATDSYAGTYLELLEAIDRARPRTGWLRSRYASVEQAVAAIRLTLQPCGMTLAKPGYPMMYTMDNSETALGLDAAAALARRAGRTDHAAEWSAMAGRMRRAVSDMLWDDKRSCYLVGIQPDGGKAEGLASWYPDVMASLMAIGWLPRSERNVTLLKRLEVQFPQFIPLDARTEEQAGQLVWWAFAARTARHTTLLDHIVGQLETYDPATWKVWNPATLGEMCRLLAGR